MKIAYKKNVFLIGENENKRKEMVKKIWVLVKNAY